VVSCELVPLRWEGSFTLHPDLVGNGVACGFLVSAT
jgi:hypothetical protein